MPLTSNTGQQIAGTYGTGSVGPVDAEGMPLSLYGNVPIDPATGLPVGTTFGLNSASGQSQSATAPPASVLSAMGMSSWDPSKYGWNPTTGVLTFLDGSGSLNFGGASTGTDQFAPGTGGADPSLGTNVMLPGGVQNFEQGVTPISDVGNGTATGTTDPYGWYANQKSGNIDNFLAAAAGLIGGPLIAGALSGAGAAGAAGGVGDAGVAGGAGSGSAFGGAGTVLTPYEAAGGSIYGSGAAGGLGDSIIATGGSGSLLGAAGGAGAAGNALAGGGSNMIDPALAQDVYGGMIDPAIQPITMPPGATPLPSTIPTTPIDPGASLQPMPSPPAGLTTPPIPTSTGGTTPTTPSTPPTPGASDVPDWLKALVPGLDALGQYITAGKASDAQAAAYQAAIDEQKREYDQTRSDYAPYLKTGTDALGRLNSLSSGDMSSFQLSPDYNFRQQQGTQGIENQFSASGGALSGNALKALNEFNSNLASGEYSNYWNRQAGLAGVGQTATGQVSQLGQNNANNVGNALIGQGDARGTGLAGQYGAFGNLANSLYRNFYPNFAGRP